MDLPGRPQAAVSTLTVEEDHHGQRLDNFLVRVCRGVPRSHVYQLIRSGQVRVNGGRSSADRKLQVGDLVRIPPVRVAAAKVPTDPGLGPAPAGGAPGPAIPLIHEDDDLLVVDKPAGLAVHGGSGVSLGLIEALRRRRPGERFLELVHRLDRETSGLLLVARRRPALLAMQQQFRDRRTVKTYLAVVVGRWPLRTRVIDLPLRRLAAPDGDRRVLVDEEGREAKTRVTGLLRLVLPGVGDCTLVAARIETGRTHQIRVHLAAEGCPVAGDDKYGDFAINRGLSRLGLRRMFLHAWRLELASPRGAGMLRFESEPGDTFKNFVVQGGGAVPNQGGFAGLLSRPSPSAQVERDAGA